MTFLPIVGRELRVASRRRGAWLNRLVAAFIAIVVGGFILIVSSSHERPTEVGNGMFTTVAGFLFIYVAIAGAVVTCDSLAEEKREGTMGLLFLTDLKGYDVVFGKLAATSLHTIYAMLAVVPLMAIPILMGGVTSAEFWRIVLVAINVLFFSLAAGMFASSVSRSDHRAMFLAFVIILALTIIPAVVADVGKPRAWIAMLSPAAQCFTGFDATYRIGDVSETFWGSVACTLIYSLIFILLACRIVPRSWHETGQRFQQRGIFATIRAILNGNADARMARRRRMLETNPYFWRAARNRTKQILVWGLLVLAAILWYWLRPTGTDMFFDIGRDLFVIVLLHAALKWWVATEACRHLSDDRRSGGLELLLSTPLSESEIVQGQRRALLYQFGGPVAVVLLFDFICLLVAIKNDTPDERAGWLFFYLIIGGFLVFDLIALSIVGMWLGLSGRKTNRATIVNLIRIVVLPTVAFTICTTLIAVMAPQSNFNATGIGIFWIVLCTVTNLAFIASAKGHLRQFRDIVAQRFTTKFDKAEPKPQRPAAPPAVPPVSLSPN
jgi:ABC-type transport system involved in multi-copper enzyme maturation permease subunit